MGLQYIERCASRIRKSDVERESEKVGEMREDPREDHKAYSLDVVGVTIFTRLSGRDAIAKV